MPEILLIRHAPTETNNKNIFTGRLDVPTTQDGLLAARRLGEELSNIQITNYFCSPLIRTKQTAMALFPHANVKVEESLIERSLGEWEGMQKQQLRIRFKSAFLPSGKLSPLYNPPHSEQIASVIARVSRFLEKIVSLDENKTVVVVTHNGIIRAIRFLVEQRDLLQIFDDSEPHLTPRVYNLNRNDLVKIQAKAASIHK